MVIINIALIGIIAGVLVVTIRQKQPELGMQVSLIAGIVIFIYVLDYLVIAVDYLRDVVNRYDIPYESITIVLKIVGIAYICEFATQVLKDTGENSLAAKVEIAGRVFIVVLSLPVITSFLTMVLGMLG